MMKQIGTLGNKPIFLVKQNDDDFMKSKIAFVAELSDETTTMSLYAATKFMPYEELKLYVMT